MLRNNSLPDALNSYQKLMKSNVTKEEKEQLDTAGNIFLWNLQVL